MKSEFGKGVGGFKSSLATLLLFQLTFTTTTRSKRSTSWSSSHLDHLHLTRTTLHPISDNRAAARSHHG